MPSVVALIIGAASSYVSFQVSLTIMTERVVVMDQRVSKLESFFLTHIQTDGHAVMGERVKNLNNQMEQIKAAKNAR